MMIELLMAMPKYEVYKDSGVEWLGEIPAHWSVKRTKYLFKEINERSNDGTEELLSVSQYTGVTKKSDRIEEGDLLTNAASLEGYKKVSIGDLVSNIMLAWNGSLGFSPYNGITSPAYSIYRLNGGGSERYFHYLLRTDLYKVEYKRKSSGVIESRLRLYTEDFFDVWSLLPLLSEQIDIAAFLDQKTAQLDQAVAIKEKQIALLKERKQILIQNAVTRGLNPDVPMRDSGVEWIGEIPEHWEVKRIKYVTYKIGSGITPAGGGTTYLESGIPLLRSQNVHFGRIDLTDVAFISPATHEMMRNSKVKKGDVLLNITGGSIGRCHYIESEQELNVNQHVCIVRPKNTISTIFLNAILTSEVGQGQIWFFQQGGGREGLNFQAIKNFFIPLPTQEEQIMIVAYIKNESAKIDQAISIQQQQIDKLKEYRSYALTAG